MGSYRHGQARHITLAWREEFPRILNDLPRRRLPNVDFPSLLSGIESQLKALLFPESRSPQVSASTCNSFHLRATATPLVCQSASAGLPPAL